MGRAPALHLGIDRDCADIVETMSRYVQYDMTPAKVARILNLDRDHPPLLTVSGRRLTPVFRDPQSAHEKRGRNRPTSGNGPGGPWFAQ